MSERQLSFRFDDRDHLHRESDKDVLNRAQKVITFEDDFGDSDATLLRVLGFSLVITGLFAVALMVSACSSVGNIRGTGEGAWNVDTKKQETTSSEPKKE